MASGYKVRLGDGSEIGPMDLEALKTWYTQGLIGRDSPVLKPGSQRWSTLAQVVELKGLGGAGRSSGGGRSQEGDLFDEGEQSSPGFTWADFDPDLWRVRVAGGIFLVGALAAGFFAWRPENAVADFDGAPWLEIALGQLVLALALLPGWELARKLVRGVVALLAIGMFPVMGILFAQGVRGAALLAVGSVWLVASGLFALLNPWLSWKRLVLSLLPILAGGYGAFRFGYAPETASGHAIRESAIPDRRFVEPSLGLSFEAPRGWLILKKDTTLVKAPAEARLLVAEPRTGGFGYLVAESSPRGVATLDQYLDRLLAERRRAIPSLKELGRADTLVGRLAGRKSAGNWDDLGVKQRDLTLAWKDGWVYFGLVSWIPEEGASRPQALDALVPGFSTQGNLADRLQKAVQKVTEEVPQLSAPAAEVLMGQSEAKVLEPDLAFRRSIEALVRSLPSLSKAETQELSQLTTATYGALASAKDRGRLSAYFERVRGRQATSSQDDREMCQLMKTALLSLPAAHRVRLQAFYERAIRSATTS